MARIEKWDEVHGNQALDEKMMAFLDSTTDQYAILQLRRSEDTVYERFSSMRELERMGLEPDIDHYEVVYTAPLLPYKDQNTMLEELYAKFNISRPDDFTGHSLSVSDIVALNSDFLSTTISLPRHWIRFVPVASWPLLPAAIRWIPRIRMHESIWRSGQNYWEPSDFLTTHSVPMPVQM